MIKFKESRSDNPDTQAETNGHLKDYFPDLLKGASIKRRGDALIATRIINPQHTTWAVLRSIKSIWESDPRFSQVETSRGSDTEEDGTVAFIEGTLRNSKDGLSRIRINFQ